MLDYICVLAYCMLLCDGILCISSSSNIDDKLDVIINAIETINQYIENMDQVESLEHLHALEVHDNRYYMNTHSKRHKGHNERQR